MDVSAGQTYYARNKEYCKWLSRQYVEKHKEERKKYSAMYFQTVTKPKKAAARALVAQGKEKPKPKKPRLTQKQRSNLCVKQARIIPMIVPGVEVEEKPKPEVTMRPSMTIFWN
jgi:hypothetical protein